MCDKLRNISDIIYYSLGSAYCYNCRYHTMTDEEKKEDYDGDPCDFCHRKEQNWAISLDTCKFIAEKILENINNTKEDSNV